MSCGNYDINEYQEALLLMALKSLMGDYNECTVRSAIMTLLEDLRSKYGDAVGEVTYAKLSLTVKVKGNNTDYRNGEYYRTASLDMPLDAEGTIP